MAARLRIVVSIFKRKDTTNNDTNILYSGVIHTDVHMKTALQITSEEVTNDKELEGTSPSIDQKNCNSEEGTRQSKLEYLEPSHIFWIMEHKTNNCFPFLDPLWIPISQATTHVLQPCIGAQKSSQV